MLPEVLATLGLGMNMFGTGLDYYQQTRQFNYDKDLQERMFEREDTAVQRRQADLQAAGLSPTLAAGNAATTMAPIRAQVPGAGIGTRAQEMVANQAALLKQQADISTTLAQKQLLEEQKKKVKQEELMLKQDELFKQMERAPFLELMQGNYYVSPDNAYGVPTGSDTGRKFRDFLVEHTANKFLASYSNDKETALTNKAITNKSIQEVLAETANAQLLGHNLGISKSFGIRSSDRIDAFLGTLAQAMGVKDGSPVTQNMQSIVLKIINGIMGLGGIKEGSKNIE